MIKKHGVLYSKDKGKGVVSVGSDLQETKSLALRQSQDHQAIRKVTSLESTRAFSVCRVSSALQLSAASVPCS